ncbi:hypothetical protein PaeBR_15920 [Paenibacillus sp. BR2-3]|uniref:hypothetical protein n=1 Tax=Paenibacillus sp. BR2-3 TaxID=3048494 RepID=UPI003977D886
MLKFQADHSTGGLPTLYLIETSETERLTFANSNTGTSHSVIDFYVPQLEAGSEGHGGFGFKDPSGNSFGATNIVYA